MSLDQPSSGSDEKAERFDSSSPSHLTQVRQVAVAKFKRVRAYLAAAGSEPGPGRIRRTNLGGSREPKLLGDLIGDFTETAQLTAPLAVAGLTLQWSAIVGEEVAEHVQISDFDEGRGRLLLATDSTAWATQIRMLVNVISNRIADEIGPDIVREIEVVGPKAPSWRHGSRRVEGRGPRDTYG